jgi:hypothetical protein
VPISLCCAASHSASSTANPLCCAVSHSTLALLTYSQRRPFAHRSARCGASSHCPRCSSSSACSGRTHRAAAPPYTVRSSDDRVRAPGAAPRPHESSGCEEPAACGRPSSPISGGSKPANHITTCVPPYSGVGPAVPPATPLRAITRPTRCRCSHARNEVPHLPRVERRQHPCQRHDRQDARQPHSFRNRR